MSLAIAVATLVGLLVLNRCGVKTFTPYVLLGVLLWVAVLKSGVHATLAGVALAAFIPARRSDSETEEDEESLAARMRHGPHPWVAYGILPVFAFANAGVPILGMSPTALLEPVPLGIALGLFVGKQIGVFSAAWLAVKSGLASLPNGVSWAQVYGLAALCGIGFTMSLFIGSLAFEDGGNTNYVLDDRIGILAGSLCSAIVGVVVLILASPVSRRAREKTPDRSTSDPGAAVVGDNC